MGIMHAKFQASRYTGVGGELCDGCTHDDKPDPYIQNSKLTPSL